MTFWLTLMLTALPVAALAFPLPLASGPRLDCRVMSLKESRTAGLVVQSRDFSCGAAAVATLLSYHFGRPTTEQEVVEAMTQAGDPELIRQKGFSLLDMKRFLEAAGYQAGGFRLELEQLERVQVPGIILIDTLSYQHFVVLKGVSEGRAFLADPALGHRAMTMEELAKAWNGVLLAAAGPQSEDALGFKLWKPEARGLSVALRPKDRMEHFIPLDPTMKIWDFAKPLRSMQ